MGLQSKFVIAASLAIATAIVTSVPPAFSQDTNQQTGSEADATPVTTGFSDLFFGYSGDYFANRTISSQISNIFGPGGFDSARFPENRIEWDANALQQAYFVHLALQNTSDPTIRVPDLANPFSTTLLLMPSAQSSSPIVGSEFIYETSPMR